MKTSFNDLLIKSTFMANTVERDWSEFAAIGVKVEKFDAFKAKIEAGRPDIDQLYLIPQVRLIPKRYHVTENKFS